MSMLSTVNPSPPPSGEPDSLDPDRCETTCIHPEQVRPLLGRVVTTDGAEQVAATFAMLADPTRTRILHALSLADELCVCDLALLVGVSQSAASHQLRLLRTHQVVTRRKAGRIAYYRLADDHIRHVLADGVGHVLEDRTTATKVRPQDSAQRRMAGEVPG